MTTVLTCETCGRHALTDVEPEAVVAGPCDPTDDCAGTLDLAPEYRNGSPNRWDDED